MSWFLNRRESRRTFLGRLAAAGLVLPGVGALAAACGDDDAATPSPFPETPEAALERLLEGNRRYAANRPAHPDQSQARKDEIAGGQRPYAAILGCSDSRVPPELVFDEGLGSLFTTRVAGGVADAAAVGSVEFGIAELLVPLVVVLGHERCGAVTAAVEAHETEGQAPGDIQSIVELILPVVESIEGQPGDPVDNAVRANAVYVARQLVEQSEIIGAATLSGATIVVAARFDLDTGLVEVLEG